jgi:hypothetical protein
MKSNLWGQNLWGQSKLSLTKRQLCRTCLIYLDYQKKIRRRADRSWNAGKKADVQVFLCQTGITYQAFKDKLFCWHYSKWGNTNATAHFSANQFTSSYAHTPKEISTGGLAPSNLFTDPAFLQ